MICIYIYYIYRIYIYTYISYVHMTKKRKHQCNLRWYCVIYQLPSFTIIYLTSPVSHERGDSDFEPALGMTGVSGR